MILSMLSLKNVSVLRNGIPILDDVSLEINQGEFVFLVGQAGAGKTTMIRLITLDLLPNSGTVIVGEYETGTLKRRQIALLRRQVGIILNDPRLLGDRDVFENVAFSLYVTNAKKNEIKERVLRVLDEVELTQRATDTPNELTVAEQQRIAIARAIVNDPLILLADEPTGNLDYAAAIQLVELLRKINSRGTAVLLATHNYELVKKVPARIVQLKNRKLQEVEWIE